MDCMAVSPKMIRDQPPYSVKSVQVENILKLLLGLNLSAVPETHVNQRNRRKVRKQMHAR